LREQCGCGSLVHPNYKVRHELGHPYSRDGF
jgi:hypothetical protein